MKNNMTIEEFYKKIGGSYENAHNMYSDDEKLLEETVKFLHDSSFAELQTCIASSNYKGAHDSAAALFELCEKLCFTELSDLAGKMKEKLYGKDTFDDIVLFTGIKNQYELVVTALRILEQENEIQ